MLDKTEKKTPTILKVLLFKTLIMLLVNTEQQNNAFLNFLTICLPICPLRWQKQMSLRIPRLRGD